MKKIKFISTFLTLIIICNTLIVQAKDNNITNVVVDDTTIVVETILDNNEQRIVKTINDCETTIVKYDKLNNSVKLKTLESNTRFYENKI
ncbi:MAG: hypothetical protein N4A50_05775 [Vallitalea sp.]|jgi:uncharacterized protein YycO|nr:hypothetical protein [Vallitalea sp.]